MAFLPLFDRLFCGEASSEVEGGGGEEMPPMMVSYGEEYWAEALSSLAAKDAEASPCLIAGGCSDSHLRAAREEAAEWIVRAASCQGFSALTALLAVTYFDRCFLSDAGGGGGGLLRLHGDKPWMGRLAAVACLSLAAKVEETRVPLLLDLQAPPPPEEAGYLFEPKTVQRMELLVLDALGWRMNPITALSFVHHLLAAAGGSSAAVRKLARRSETALLVMVPDWRWVRHPASVWAAAALLHAAEWPEIHRRRLVSLLRAPKGATEECRQLMAAAMNVHKRKHHSSSSPASPSEVIGSCFSAGECSSSGSWPPWTSPVEAPPPNKKLNAGGVNGDQRNY
ncbi:cyclin-D3-2-like [Curcuma longa]|uniref:cyclin-D3-2-like n=1 Tax=Curcuma longa TaxID=136217 RepID=UPI003D9F5072